MRLPRNVDLDKAEEISVAAAEAAESNGASIGTVLFALVIAVRAVAEQAGVPAEPAFMFTNAIIDGVLED